jgi:hypothetical protein
MALKHNKKRNTYIIYEQLLSLASRLSIAKRKNESRFVISLLKECFCKNSLLFQEKKLFESLLEGKEMKEGDAREVIIETLEEASGLSSKILEEEKTRLIQKITSKLSKRFFDMPVKNYKLLASTQILFNESRLNGVKVMHTTPQERTKIKKVLLERMSRPVAKEDDYQVDNFTYNLLIKKYNEKYTKLINEDQRDLLKGWINYSLDKDTKKFNSIIDKKKDKVKTALRSCLLKESVKDNENYTELKEAYDKLSNFSPQSVKEEDLYQLMKYFDLKEDLEALINNG